jgi:hypothetical protein
VQHPDIKIHLTLSRIPSDKGNDKCYTMAVEVQVNWKHLEPMHELMIKIFKMKQDVLPHGIFFIPTLTNGFMPYELYYQSLHAHHDHVADNFVRRTALYELRALSIDREVLERLE